MNGSQINTLAEELLMAVKLKEATISKQEELSVLEYHDLKALLDNDNKKKAFWINLYNAFYQILFIQKKVRKPAIYNEKLIDIADMQFSLDDIEHGILRKHKFKYSLGFLSNPFSKTEIKTLAVKTVDYRIHFALNCGARSCPPIAFYKASALDSQLDMATQSFLEQESDFDNHNKVLYTTALFKWFLGDFGGKKGIRHIYDKQLGKNLEGYSIKYTDYSWEEELDNFVS